MSTDTQIVSVSKTSLWAGRIIGAFVVLFLAVDRIMKLMNIPVVLEINEQLGIPLSAVPAIGILLLVCTALYAIPRTAALGAILLTGYLGGATFTHVRVGDPFFFPIVMGVLAWAALLLRDRRLWNLLARA